ncbi:TrmH family RNA methyltransferase [Criblamydia sequanensis]|uniref:rRNA methylase n=1 Tax=Candidatus Criblamydia sequanensis CRIB-18 TaxID=1437425 RepID=A0A090D2I5_9BACT|nr:RNA methyltransferase [Criblamydia sequanensis]CDR34388.1 Putative rRNA methylase [Criblamydia sequanensis CRIB-18]
MLLTSLQNPKIKRAVKLMQRRAREGDQAFLIEGHRELLRAQESGQKLECLFYCPALFLEENEEALIEAFRKEKVEIFECIESVFRKISYRDRPDGLIGIGRKHHRTLSDLEALIKKTENPLIIVAEAIEKPGNLGTILRSSDAVDATALIVADPLTDIHNPNVIRASVGTVFTVPVFEMEGKALLEWLKKNQISIVAATPHSDIEFTKANLKGPIAIAFGTEKLGLSPLWMDKADIKVKIPMLGRADSLNVAMAATLLMFEALRQRS